MLTLVAMVTVKVRQADIVGNLALSLCGPVQWQS